MSLDDLAEKLARDRYRRTGIPFPAERLTRDIWTRHYLGPARSDLEFLFREGVLNGITTPATT